MDETTERPRDEARRWKLAEWLNKRYPLMCWADLVTWAIGRTEWEDVNKNGRCGTDADYMRNGACYCGKFSKNS